jgi:hypothetical protein
MKTPRSVAAVLLVLPLLGCATHHSQELLPGLTYYPGPETLCGELVFLVQHDYTVRTNSSAAASVYGLRFGKPELRKITDAPAGLFLTSENGTLFCSVSDSNVFVYLAAGEARRAVILEAPPAETSLADGHAFFVVESVTGTRLLDYDAQAGRLAHVELSGASRWQYEHYDRVHFPPGTAQTVHFYYKGYGRKLSAGTDYADGFYTLNLSTRDVGFYASLTRDNDDPRYTWRAANGHYIFFDGSGAPAEGFRLVSSPRSDFDTKLRDPQGKDVSLLHNFSKLPAVNHGMYLLAQMSPDARFALVRLQKPALRKSGMLPGFVNTYYLVDALSGKTRVLLRDEMERKTISSISSVHWVGNPE